MKNHDIDFSNSFLLIKWSNFDQTTLVKYHCIENLIFYTFLLLLDNYFHKNYLLFKKTHLLVSILKASFKPFQQLDMPIIYAQKKGLLHKFYRKL